VANVLVVEDDTVIRELVTACLASAGHQVSAARSAPEGLDMMAGSGPFELVVLDLMLGRESGWDVVEQMEQRGVRGRTRILVLTARTSEVDIIEGWERGVDEYLTKPFAVDELLRAVDHVLEASPRELDQRRRHELHKAKLLGFVEGVFTEPPQDRSASR
jgi:two-component system, OmpR family, alkaline phosphatase synthesis response regulator PhoP